MESYLGNDFLERIPGQFGAFGIAFGIRPLAKTQRSGSPRFMTLFLRQLLLRSRMRLVVDIHYMLDRQLGVALRGGQAFVP